MEIIYPDLPKTHIPGEVIEGRMTSEDMAKYGVPRLCHWYSDAEGCYIVMLDGDIISDTEDYVEYKRKVDELKEVLLMNHRAKTEAYKLLKGGDM